MVYLEGIPTAVIVMHGDICADFQLEQMLNAHESRGDGDHVTIMSIQAKKDDSSAFGCLVSDPSTHEVSVFIPATVPRCVQVVPVYVFPLHHVGCLRDEDGPASPNLSHSMVSV